MEDNFRRVPPPPPPRPNIPRVPNENSLANASQEAPREEKVETFQLAEQVSAEQQGNISPSQETKKSSKEKIKLSLLIVGSICAFIGSLICGYFLFFS